MPGIEFTSLGLNVREGRLATSLAYYYLDLRITMAEMNLAFACLFFRYEFPAGILEGVDFACLFMLLISTSIQSYLIADLREKMDFPRKHPWLTGNFIVVLISFVDLIISINLGNDSYR